MGTRSRREESPAWRKNMTANVESAFQNLDDFPQICETCLGPNPFVRMMKMPMSRECKVSSRPYTAFRFKPGSNARYKETVISKEVALAKNICQVCLFDMDYQLPVAVRDELLGVNGADELADVPQSDINKEYYWNQKREAIEHGAVNPMIAGSGGAMRGGGAGGAPDRRIAQLARTTPYYERNRAKPCSFWIKGSCTRVGWGDCPYRPCNGDFRFPELNAHPEKLAELQKLLADIGPAEAMIRADEETKKLIHESQCGNRDTKIRDRYYGVNDPLANKMIAKMKEQPGLEPPEDKSITPLYVGGVTSDISEKDLRDEFYAYGELKDIRMAPRNNCAFVSYTTRDAAEEAAERLSNRLIVKGIRLKLMWGKPKIRDDPKPGQTSGEIPMAGPVGVSAPPAAAAGGAAAGGYAMPSMPTGAAGQQLSYPSMDGRSAGSKRT